MRTVNYLLIAVLCLTVGVISLSSDCYADNTEIYGSYDSPLSSAVITLDNDTIVDGTQPYYYIQFNGTLQFYFPTDTSNDLSVKKYISSAIMPTGSYEYDYESALTGKRYVFNICDGYYKFIIYAHSNISNTNSYVGVVNVCVLYDNYENHGSFDNPIKNLNIDLSNSEWTSETHPVYYVSVNSTVSITHGARIENGITHTLYAYKVNSLDSSNGLTVSYDGFVRYSDLNGTLRTTGYYYIQIMSATVSGSNVIPTSLTFLKIVSVDSDSVFGSEEKPLSSVDINLGNRPWRTYGLSPVYYVKLGTTVNINQNVYSSGNEEGYSQAINVTDNFGLQLVQSGQYNNLTGTVSNLGTFFVMYEDYTIYEHDVEFNRSINQIMFKVIDVTVYTTLSFNVGNGTNAPETMVQSAPNNNNQIFVIPDTIPTNIGSYFIGWALSSASDVKFNVGDSVEVVGGSNMVLFAVYSPFTIDSHIYLNVNKTSTFTPVSDGYVITVEGLNGVKVTKNTFTVKPSEVGVNNFKIYCLGSYIDVVAVTHTENTETVYVQASNGNEWVYTPTFNTDNVDVLVSASDEYIPYDNYSKDSLYVIVENNTIRVNIPITYVKNYYYLSIKGVSSEPTQTCYVNVVFNLKIYPPIEVSDYSITISRDTRDLQIQGAVIPEEVVLIKGGVRTSIYVTDSNGSYEITNAQNTMTTYNGFTWNTADGSISGSPARTGTFVFTQVFEATPETGGQKITRTVTINVITTSSTSGESPVIIIGIIGIVGVLAVITVARRRRNNY